jgi:ATP-dependent exoDNAse (exonuclease V) beta subunit
MTRGKIVHAVLDRFFHHQPKAITWETAEERMKLRIQNLLVDEWKKSKKELSLFRLSQDQEMLYFEESLVFLFSWLYYFNKRLKPFRDKLEFEQAFEKITPILREATHLSDEYAVRGIIDAVEQIENETNIIDYKTSRSCNLNEHRLQLAIYALLYQEVHGKMPTKAGIHFLREQEPKFISVDRELVEFAKEEVRLIHEKTVSADIKDYPKTETALCRWSEGKCDFYDYCQKE